MSREIDQLDLSTAKEIQKWLLPSIVTGNEVQLKTNVRNYLRDNKLTPYQALEMIRKQNSSMPKRIF